MRELVLVEVICSILNDDQVSKDLVEILMHTVHAVQVCTKCIDTICQHPGDNELDRHGGANCRWIGQLTLRI